MVLPPLLYRADERELIEFFGSVARATELPLMVYNNPLGSGSDLGPELLRDHRARGAEHHRVQGDLGRRSADRRAHQPVPGFDVLVGGDDWALEGLCAGAVGWVSGVADVLPAQSVRLFDLCVAGELATARELYAELLPLARLDMKPKLVQYFKAALDELGIGGGPCRPPRLPLTDGELAEVRRAVERFSPAARSRRDEPDGARAPVGRARCLPADGGDRVPATYRSESPRRPHRGGRGSS